VATERRRYADAARLLGASDVLRERTLLAIPATERLQREARLERLRMKLGEATLAGLLAEGSHLSMEEVVRLTADDSVGHTAEYRVSASVAPEPHAHANARPRLRVLALGPLQVYVGGKLVDAAAWGSARPRELLAYLLVHPDGRTKEQAGLAFWPDASAAQLRNNFHVTLHRLRKALGSTDWIGLAGDRYRVDPAVLEEFDAAEFERDVTAARRALQRQEEGAADRMEQALARYRGDFLDGEPMGDWHVEHRDRLQRLFVDSLMTLGASLAKERRYDRAAESYRRVLGRDELHEEALQALMRCHAGLGERSQALRAYLQFADRLKRELEAEPDRETARLYERLQQGTGL
jgi:DNA-binding SARP family transcriptional activator